MRKVTTERQHLAQPPRRWTTRTSPGKRLRRFARLSGEIVLTPGRKRGEVYAELRGVAYGHPRFREC
jgi:hypothetical protein